MRFFSSPALLDEVLKIWGGKAALINILAGRYRAAGLERLNTNSLLSIHPNPADRILLAIVEIEGERCFTVMDIALNHDYHKARAMRVSDIGHLIKTGELKPITFDDLERTDTESANASASASSSASTEATIDIREVRYFGEQLIELNDAQSQTLQLSLPLLIGGGPGSGKSCSAMQILERLQAEIQEPNERVIYLTRSARLARKMESDWVLQGGYEQTNYKQVLFMTYEELLEEELWPEGHPDQDKIFIGKEGFAEWWSIRCKQHANKRWKSESIDKIYQEFRLISGYTEKQYLELGKRQSLYSDTTDRTALYRAYEAYQAELARTNKIDTNFYTPPGEKKYRFIVDEARDLSNGQLRNLTRLSKDCSIVCCVDSNQSLEDDESNRDFILQMFKEESGKKEVSHVELPGSYRCPKNILLVADAMLQIKHAVTGGLTDKHEAHSLICTETLSGCKEGSVEYVSPGGDLTNCIEKAKSTSLVVVTEAQYREEARKLFDTPLIFTPEEIKGLEFPSVIVYKLFENLVYTEINARLPDTLMKKARHRAKHDADRMPEFGPPMNRIFTAVTRAQDELIICQNFTRALSKIEQHVKSVAEQSSAAAEAAPTQEASPAQWEQMLWRLFDNGSRVQAQDIFTSKLGGKVSEFDQFLANRHKATPQVVQAASIAEKVSEPSALPQASIAASVASLQETQKDVVALTEPKKPASPKFSGTEVKPALTRIIKKSTNPTAATAAKAPAAVSSTTRNTAKTADANSVPKQSKFVDYAERLILDVNFNEENVKTLLSHSKVNEILNTSVSGKTVYEYIIDSQGKMKVLLKTLEEPEYMDKIELYVVSRYLDIKRLATCGKKEMPIVLKVLENNCQLSANFTEQEWNSLLPMQSTDFPAEAELPLASLLKTTSGRKVLNVHLKTDRSWYDRVSIKQLSNLCNMRACRKQKMPLIYFLCCTPETLEFLIEYLERNVAFLNDEELRLLGAALSATSPETSFTDVSALFLLLNHYAIRMNAIFVKNKKLFHYIDWGTLLNKCVPQYGGLSLLYLITQNFVKEGENVNTLADLVKEIPDIFKKISHENMNQRIKPRNAQTKSHVTSIFSLMCLHPNNHSILRKIYQENPELYKQITMDDLCMPCSSESPTRSAMWYLLLEKDGAYFLNDLFIQNPELCKKISREILFQKIPIDGQDIYFFYWFSIHPVSAEVLNKIFESNPDLYQAITMDRLCYPWTRKGIAFKPLHNFSQRAEGVKFLTTLFEKNPSLLTQLSYEELFGQIEHPDGQTVSVFYYLTITIETLELLNQIFQANPDLYQKITVDDLCFNSRTQKGTTYTPLYILSGTDFGRKFLRELLEKNPDIFKKIPSTELCRPLESKASSTSYVDNGTSPIYWLAANESSRDSL